MMYNKYLVSFDVYSQTLHQYHGTAVLECSCTILVLYVHTKSIAVEIVNYRCVYLYAAVKRAECGGRGQTGRETMRAEARAPCVFFINIHV